MPTSITTPTSLLGVSGPVPAVASTSPLTTPVTPVASPTPAVSGGSLAGTMTTPTNTPPAPVYNPTTAGQATPTAQSAVTQPSATATSPNQTTTLNGQPTPLAQAMNALQIQTQASNQLVSQKNLILKQLYDTPLSDADKAQLDPTIAATLASGDRNAIDFQLKLLNDQIAGRTNTLSQNVQFLTNNYMQQQQQLETQKNDAINNVLNYAKANGQKPSVILNALYPQLAASLGPELDQIAAPYGQYIPLSGSSAGGVNGYDISTYASNPQYPQEISNLATQIGQVSTAAEAQNYISNRAPNSPITGDMIIQAAQQYGVDPTMMLAIMTQETQLGTDSSKGSAQNNFGNVGNTDSLMAAGGSVAKSDPQAGVNAVAQWLSNHKAGAITGAAPTGPGANIADPATGLTPNGLYAAALQYAANGTMPSLGLGSAPQTKNARQQIISTAGAILAANGGTIAGNKAAIASNAASLTQQTNYLNTIQRSVNTVDSNIKLLQEAAQHVNDSSAPIVNQITNDVKLSTGDGALNAFNTALQTVRSEYANILARGGQVTDQNRNDAATLLPSNLNAAQLQSVINVLQSEGQNVLTAAQGQVSSIQNNINQIVQPAGASGASGGGSDNDPLGILGQ